MVLRPRENLVGQKLSRAESEGAMIESTVQRLSDTANDPLEDEEQSRDDLIEELRYQKASNEAFRKACEEAILQLSNGRTGHTIRNTKAINHSHALAGAINTINGSSHVRLDISNTTAEDWSFAGAGIINNLDLSSVLSNNNQNTRAKMSDQELSSLKQNVG